MKLLLDLATLLGGLSAAWFLWEKAQLWNRRFSRRSDPGTPQPIRTNSIGTETATQARPSSTNVGGWLVLFGALAIASGGFGALCAVLYGDGSFILLLGGSMLIGFLGDKLSERYVVLQKMLAAIAFPALIGGMAAFGAYLVRSYFGVLTAPRTAFFFGAGLISVCIVALWVSSISDSGTKTSPGQRFIPWSPPSRPDPGVGSAASAARRSQARRTPNRGGETAGRYGERH